MEAAPGRRKRSKSAVPLDAPVADATLDDAIARDWPFLPPGIVSGFDVEAERLTQLQTSMQAMFQHLEAVTARAQDTTDTKELLAVVKELKRTQMQFVQPQMETVLRGMAQLARNHKTLQEEYWKFSRGLISHMNQRTDMHPYRSSDGLIKNPYVAI